MPISRQPDLFSSAMQQPYTLPVSNGNKTFNGKEQEVIGDLFSQQNGNGQADKPAIPVAVLAAIPEPAPFSNELQSFHRNDCLVVDGWVGYLQSVDTADGTAVFHPLQLPPTQKQEPKRIYRYVMFTNSFIPKKHSTKLNTKKKGKTLTDCTMPLSKGMAI